MGYFDDNIVLRSFELRFDNEDEAKQVREEIVTERMNYDY